MGRELITVASDLTYSEGPRWHNGRLFFSDYYTYRVLSAAEDGSDLRVEAEVPQQPSGLGWLPDGRLLVVSSTQLGTPECPRQAPNSQPAVLASPR